MVRDPYNERTCWEFDSVLNYLVFLIRYSGIASRCSYSTFRCSSHLPSAFGFFFLEYVSNTPLTRTNCTYYVEQCTKTKTIHSIAERAVHVFPIRNSESRHHDDGGAGFRRFLLRRKRAESSLERDFRTNCIPAVGLYYNHCTP
jgi:hypothetical protein